MHLERTNAETFTEMSEEIDWCGDLLSTADIGIAVFGCTTGSLVGGSGYDMTVESRLNEATGVPTVAAAAAIKRVFSALGVGSLAITTPCIGDLNRRKVTFLEEAGYDVVDITGLGIETNVDISRLPRKRYLDRQRGSILRPLTQFSSVVLSTAPSPSESDSNAIWEYLS